MPFSFDDMTDKALLDRAIADTKERRDVGTNRRSASLLALRARINRRLKAGADEMTVARDFGYESEPGLKYALGILDLVIERDKRLMCSYKRRP